METLHLIILVLHVVGAVIIAGGFFCTYLLLSRKEVSKEVFAACTWLGEIIGPLLGLQLLTGIYLVWSESDTMAHNPLVWTKLILFIGLGILSAMALKSDRRLKASNTALPDIVAMWRTNTALRVTILFLIVILGVIVAETAS